MPAAPLPSDEAERLAALRSYDILDSACEEAFDDIAELAASLTGSPMALISLLDAERQWFKARVGLAETETPRDMAFCAHAILDPSRPLVVPDARLDPRFADNPLVLGAPDIRAYLGVPIVNPEGHALGTLCVLDHAPRRHEANAIRIVERLARTVSTTMELRRALQRLRDMAMTDPLTGLLNRRAVDAALAGFAAAGTPLAALALDLDHFKEANDAEGHAAGDAILVATAERLRACVRPGDLLGRLGGDEFVAILPEVSGHEDALRIAERISTALKAPVPVGARQLRLGATIGVALATAGAGDPALLLRAADEALMRAKRDGRGGIGRASRRDSERLLRAAAVLRAFDSDVVDGEAAGASVRLQPVLRLDGAAPGFAGKVIALEALARWTHPDVGEVPPDELLPAIGPERAATLGRLVRRQALEAVAAMRASGLTDARLALNLSAREVARADICASIADQVEAAGLTLGAVEIEITEEVLQDRVSDRTLDQLASLRGRGARLVLDDFGAGSAGLAQLLRLPLDAVKLDGRFVQRLGTDMRATEIVRATVSLARGLGLLLVAEGVETSRQASLLASLGCEAAQGYLFSRPAAPEALAEWLGARSGREVLHLTAAGRRQAI